VESSLSSSLCPFPIADQWQTLIVFPDLWTMFNQWRDIETLRNSKIENGVAVLLSGDTEKQKDVHRWEIKKWLQSVIICTYAEIFQDFKNLQKIIFVDPHKRYYSSQQDPRYKVGDVIEKMQELYWSALEIINI
jgi:primosomal protein N'